MLRVAVLGASDFIGARLIEILHLNSLAQIKAIANEPQQLLLSARFKIEFAIAESQNREALALAFSDCKVVFDCTMGKRNVKEIKALYAAAQDSKVERIIFLSSAFVHGLAPAEGVVELSPYPSDSVYAKAEEQLMMCRQNGNVEVSIIRPCLVYGPRSKQWTLELANNLLAGNIYQLGDGQGICNCLYVDNLVQFFIAVMRSSSSLVDCQAFFVSDAELVTWSEFFTSFATGLGIDPSDIRTTGFNSGGYSKSKVFQNVLSAALKSSLKNKVPLRIRRALKEGLNAYNRHEAVSAPKIERQDVGLMEVSEELLEMQLCKYKLPMKKAFESLGFKPEITFFEGVQRSLKWLEFAGYSVSSTSSD